MEGASGVGLVRIVGGSLRGRRLRVPDRGVRPTSEKTREAIFDILGPRLVQGARVLDLFAGTGAMGIEALSRGADRADFVEGGK
ncbi:MAG TPA: RsmD family RNA methyltransferase, partial [Candidatus Eisenbacteria bacterium]|nr:RsmD family RNA methyltransferase [Candidatus Eisenbacteria bacterium]